MAYPLFLIKLLVRSGLARLLPSVQRLTDGGGGYLRYYSDRILGAPHAELREAAAFLEAPGSDAIDLATGSPRFDLVPSGSTKLPADRRGFPPPWGLPELRAAVAERLHADHLLAVNPADEVLITHGVTGAFTAALESFVNPGNRVVLFDPTSPMYVFALRHRRARIRWVPTWMENGRLRFHLEPLVKALGRARMIVINSPANPTGGILRPEDLEQIAWWADRRDVLIFNDDVFERFRYEGETVHIGSLDKARRRTISAGSVSKGYALAAARVGWLAGYRHLVRPCALSAALQTPFVPTLCQQIAHAALRQPSDLFRPIHAEFAARRQYTYERLQSMGLQPAWPAGAFCFWIPVHQVGFSGQVFAEKLFRSRKVLVWPGHHFGPSGASYVRLSYGGDEGRLREGLGRLAEFLRELQAAPGSQGVRQAA